MFIDRRTLTTKASKYLYADVTKQHRAPPELGNCCALLSINISSLRDYR